MDDRADKIIRDCDTLANARGTFEAQWEEVAERVVPRSSRLFFARGPEGSTPGEKKTERMLDSTAAIALERYHAVLNALLTPQSQTWHRLRASLPELNRIPNVQRWFAEVNERLFVYRDAPRANFMAQQQESYMSVGAFGTGIKFIDWDVPQPTDKAGGLRYRFIHLSEAYLRENHQGAVDSCLRRFTRTARQVKQLVDMGKFDRMPPAAERALDKTPDQPFKFIHCVQPSTEYHEGRLDWRGMAWEAHYVSVEDRVIVKEGGFSTFPYTAGRSTVSPGEIYGRSPAMAVLPNIKVLNAQKAVNLKMGHRMADPVLLAHDDGILDGFSLAPGFINSGGINSAGQKLIQPLDDNRGQIPFVKDLQDDERAVINDAFMVTLFQVLVDSGNMTATEVIERAREKAILLSPMGRFQSEEFGPQIEREIDLLVRAGRLPPMPRELVEAAGDYVIEYDSPLNRAMKSEELAGFTRWVEIALNAAAATKDPTPLDWINWDTAMPETAPMMAVPPRWVRLKEEVDGMREARQQATDTQTAIQAAPAAADVMKGMAAMQQGARRAA